MSIIRPHTQEGLSVVYVRAIAAKAGYTVARFEWDYGIDYVVKPVRKVGKRCWPLGPSLHIQIKSSQNFRKLQNGNILYNLDVDTYNLLIREDTGEVYILVLYLMPKDEKEWLSVCDESTKLKHCGYWKYLGGMGESDHKETVQIEISSDNIFNEASLNSIIDSIESKGVP